MVLRQQSGTFSSRHCCNKSIVKKENIRGTKKVDSCRNPKKGIKSSNQHLGFNKIQLP